MFAAALGKNDLVIPDNTGQDQEEITVSAENLATLLVNFLNKLIFLSDTKQGIYLKFNFQKLNQKSLLAKTWGQPIPYSGFITEIKAATFHNLDIKKTKSGYQAIVLFDI